MKREFVRIGVAFALLLGLLFFVRWHRSGEEREIERKGKEAQLLSVDPATIDRLRISAESGSVTLVRLGEEKAPDEFSEIPDWRIAEPVRGFADRTVVATLLGNLKSLSVVKVISEEGSGAAGYGLDPATLTIEGYAKEGKDPLFVLHGGDLNTAGSGMYFQAAGNPRIVLVETTLEGLKTRKLFDWRMKEIVGVRDPQAVRKVTVETFDGGKRSLVTAERDAAKKWVLAEPEKARADAAEVERFFNELSSLRASGIPSDDAVKEAKRFGFDRPLLRVTVGLENGERKELVLGRPEKKDANEFPLRREGVPQVFLISSYHKNKMGKTFRDWVAKNPFDLAGGAVTGIEIVRDGSTVELWSKEGKWIAAKPAGFDPDEAKVAELVGELVSLQGREYVGRRGAPKGKPDLRIVLSAGEEKRDVAFFQNAKKEDELFVLPAGVGYLLNATDKNRIKEMSGGLAKSAEPAPDPMAEEKE